MPTRYIRESCRTSKNLQAVSDFAERLFWRLLTVADDFGRFIADPRVVGATCFPFADRIPLKKVSDALRDLTQHRLIILYTVGERTFGEFVTFSIHQRTRRSKRSKFPAPPKMTSERNQEDESLSVTMLQPSGDRVQPSGDRVQPLGSMLQPGVTTGSPLHSSPLSCLSSLSSSPDSESPLQSSSPDKPLTPTPTLTPNLHPEIKSKSDARARGKHLQPKDVDWFDRYRDDEFYAKVNVEQEFHKAVRWAEVNRRKMTKLFFQNWLNRAVDQQVPLTAPPTVKTCPITPARHLGYGRPKPCGNPLPCPVHTPPPSVAPPNQEDASHAD